MDAAQALSELTEISSQIDAAVVLDEKGAVAGTIGHAEQLADTGRRLVEEAARMRGAEPAQLEAATASGSIFVLREGGKTIVARTGAEPTVGLVFYDLKSCLRSLDAAPKPRAVRAASTTKPTSARRSTRKKKESDGAS